MTEDDDLLLVEEVLAGNEDAFRRLVEKYERRIFGIVYHYLGPGDEVEDVAQEVFIKIYKGLSGYDASKPFAPWAYRVAVNRCLDELRRRRLRRSIRFSELTPAEEAQTHRLLQKFQSDELGDDDVASSAQILQKILARLNDKDRMAFVLREVEGMEYEQLAALMKSSQNSVRIRVFRARKKLKEMYLKIARSQVAKT